MKGERQDGTVFPLDISLGYFPFKTETSEKLYIATMREIKSTSGNSGGGDKSRELSQLLDFNDLAEFVEVFKTEEVDLKSFLMLSDDDLKGMGIKLGPRLKIMALIEEQKKSKPQDVEKRHPSGSSSSLAFVIESTDLVFHDIIGRGSFGVVHKYRSPPPLLL